MKGELIRGKNVNTVQPTTTVHDLPLPPLLVLGSRDAECMICGENDAGHTILSGDFLFCSWCKEVYDPQLEATFK